jgi:uncharacterized membrane protein
MTTAEPHAGPIRGTLGHDDRVLLHHLRHRRPGRTGMRREPPGVGARMADGIARWVGSWPFVLAQSGLLLLWIAANVVGWIYAWDPFPFILLNLMLSFQAAYTAPIIMMSQNRQAEIDRNVQAHDYEVNLKAELEIEELHQKIDLLREQEVVELTRLVRELAESLQELRSAPPPTLPR